MQKGCTVTDQVHSEGDELDVVEKISQSVSPTVSHGTATNQVHSGGDELDVVEDAGGLGQPVETGDDQPAGGLPHLPPSVVQVRYHHRHHHRHRRHRHHHAQVHSCKNSEDYVNTL